LHKLLSVRHLQRDSSSLVRCDTLSPFFTCYARLSHSHCGRFNFTTSHTPVCRQHHLVVGRDSTNQSRRE
jgi:hypothetical protein